ncbi:MAG TPA: NAD(P)H-binding protein [Puia sp.]|jgi:uncharacterized protein YbjT (DUF2867 family)|nr:NAD(P)H-binding protein [Puia sp.]
MKIILTGSLGHIGKPLTEELVQKGHGVIVISSKPEKQKDIEALGAVAAIGNVEDAEFLTKTFKGADLVYTMLPPANSYFDPNFDLMRYTRSVASNFAKAIRQSDVKRVIHLSSIGAHLEKGSGLILYHRAAEDILNNLSDVSITFMRPVGFYYNLYSFLPVIKKQGFIAANYGADDHLVWVSPIDIAAAIVHEIETQAVHRKIIYVASDELTGNETASILGEAIGKPDLKWILLSNEQWQSRLEAAGMNPVIATGFIEMFAAQHSGLLMEDYYRNRPGLGKVKMKDFAKEFATVYYQK